jgi:hypothetical protein
MLFGNTSIVVTDHTALKSLTNPNKEFDTERMTRMALELSEHDLVIVHRPGTSNELCISDMMSRADTLPKAQVDSLLEQTRGSMAAVVADTKVHLSEQLLSGEASTKRLRHHIDGIELADMIKDKEITTVKEMVQAIVSGDRPSKPQTYQTDDTPTRFEEFYDMIAGVDTGPAKAGAATAAAVGMRAAGCATAEVGVTDDQIRQAQAEDEHCQALISLVRGSQGQSKLPASIIKALEWKAPYHLVGEDGILRRLCWRTSGKSEVRGLEGSTPAVIPASNVALRAKLCELLHRESGHSGYLKTLQNGLERFIWSGMQAELMQHSKNCNQCNYYGDKRPAAPITGHVTAEEPAHRIQMDAVHMTDTEGAAFMITLCDIFSRWAIAVPVKDLKSKTVVQALRRHAIPQGMGRPGEFLLDGGSEFAGFLKAACEAWGTKYRIHTPHHSQSAGIIERLNKTLELRIAHFSRECKCNWLDALPLALESYNGSVHISLSQGQVGVSPAEVWLSRKLRFNSDVRARLHDRPTDVQQYVEWMKLQTAQVKLWITTADASYRAAMIKAKNNRAALRSLQLKDEVVLFVPTERKSKNSGAS